MNTKHTHVRILRDRAYGTSELAGTVLEITHKNERPDKRRDDKRTYGVETSATREDRAWAFTYPPAEDSYEFFTPGDAV
jgi:hypothetical protein